MTPELWKCVQPVFLELLEKPDKERAAALDAACDGDEELRLHVQELLEVHPQTDFLDRPVIRFGDLPSRIGPYQPLRLLGQGGMGRVFLAERVDGEYERRVALKLLHPGLDTSRVLHRFRQERQILANLQHPNIAALLDGGSSDDGQPYLVMEYVEGVTLDQYCQQQKLSLRARLRLFLSVCSAVGAAHRNLVIHRDLKPGNILVTAERQPKLLDFGIAKLLRPDGLPVTEFQTEEGTGPLTPAFASPEQVRGGVVTTATDVYSLGAVLYDLLTGFGPHRLKNRDPAELVEVVCHEEVMRPSAAVSGLPVTAAPVAANLLVGDLDHIALKALRKEPARRYVSVERLAADIEAYLSNRPVKARGERFFYRSSRFVRRHRIAVTASALGLAGLITFSAALWIQQGQLVAERDLARSTADILQDLLRSPDPTRPQGETITVREVLDRQAHKLDRLLEGPAAVRAGLRDTLGTTYLNLGLYEEAAEQFLRALDVRSADSRRRDAPFGNTLLSLARVRQLQGNLAAAKNLARQALDTSRHLDKASPELKARSRLRLGKIHELVGDFDAAEGELLAGLALLRSLESKEAKGALGSGLDDYATLLSLRGRPERAKSAFEEALEVLRELHGERHPEVAATLNNLALVVADRAPENALDLLRQAEAINLQLYGAEDRQLVPTLNNLAYVLFNMGRRETSEVVFDRALRVLGPKAGDDPRMAPLLNSLAERRLARGELDEAEALHGQALALNRKLFGERHRQTAVSLNNLGVVLMRKDDLKAAKPLLQQALDISRESFGNRHPQTAAALSNLGLLARHRSDFAVAVSRFQEALRVIEITHGEDHREVAQFAYNLARAYEAREDFALAEESYQRATTIARRDVDATDLSRYLVGLAGLRQKSGNLAAAAQVAAQAEEMLSKASTDDDPWLSASRRILGTSLAELGRYGEAEPMLLRRHAALAAARGRADPDTQLALAALIELYMAWSRPVQAAELRCQLEAPS